MGKLFMDFNDFVNFFFFINLKLVVGFYIFEEFESLAM